MVQATGRLLNRIDNGEVTIGIKPPSPGRPLFPIPCSGPRVPQSLSPSVPAFRCQVLHFNKSLQSVENKRKISSPFLPINSPTSLSSNHAGKTAKSRPSQPQGATTGEPGRFLFPVFCSLFSAPCLLFPVFCSLFPVRVPCSLLPIFFASQIPAPNQPISQSTPSPFRENISPQA